MKKAIIGAVALAVVGAGTAGAAECEKSLRAWEAKWSGAAAMTVRVRPQYSNDLTVLRRAALVFARHGQEGACARVVDGLKELAVKYEKETMAAGKKVKKTEAADDEARRKKLLADAKPVAEMGHGLRLDMLIGADVRSPHDKQLGEIEDIVSANGKLTHVLVAHGGFLGIGEDLVAIPWKRLRIAVNRDDDGDVDERIFVLNMTKAQFDTAPTLKRGDTKLLRDETWQKRNDGYYQGKK